jgi:hypothetical protein
VSLGAEVDAEVDLGPLVFELMGGLKASLDTLNQHLRNIAKVEAAYQGGVIEVPIRKVAASGATGNLVIGCGGPAYGRIWEVKRLTVGGVLWTTTVAGQALVVVGSVSDGQVTPPLTDVADQAASLPDIAYYSTRQLVVRHPAHLFVVIVAPSATTQYAVGGQVSDFPDKRNALDTEN